MLATLAIAAAGALGGLLPLPQRAGFPAAASTPLSTHYGLALSEIATIPRAEAQIAIAENVLQFPPLLAILNEFNTPPYGRTLFVVRHPSDVYAVEDSLAGVAPAALGDFDGDGLLDLLGQFGPVLRVYEASVPGGYPDHLAWESPSMTNVEGMPTIADSDRDGRIEFLHSVNLLSGPSHLVIFEATGNNDDYAEVYSGPPGRDAMGKKCVADIDGDGWPEIIMSGLIGRVEVYEATADNAWQQTWTTETGLLNAYSVDGGYDLDLNGRPEFLVSGAYNEFPTIVFEAKADNIYSQRDRFVFAQSAGGIPNTAIAELDGESPGEFMEAVLDRIVIWRHGSCGRWEVVGEVSNADFAHYAFHVADMNKNGRTEVIWAGFPTTAILEAPAPTDVASPTVPGAMHITPNPCRGQFTISHTGPWPPGSTIRVYDVAGRVVASWKPAAPSGQFALRLSGASAGTYLVETRDFNGRSLATARAVLVR